MEQRKLRFRGADLGRQRAIRQIHKPDASPERVTETLVRENYFASPGSVRLGTSVQDCRRLAIWRQPGKRLLRERLERSLVDDSWSRGWLVLNYGRHKSLSGKNQLETGRAGAPDVPAGRQLHLDATFVVLE